MATAVKITDKGQVTIPREIRKALNTNLIFFSVVNGVVTLRPVHDVGGALRAYAENATSTASSREIKDAAWEEAIREKTSH